MGPFSLTGQPNAMGGREVGGLSNQLAAHMSFDKPAHLDRVRRFWGAPRLARRPGLKAVDLFDAVLDGRIKALAVTTARLAAPPLDTIPPIADTLAGFDAAGWSGLAAPARTPLEIVAKVNKDLQALLRDPEVVRQIERRAGLPAPGSPIQFTEFIKKEIDTWGEVVRATGTKPGT